MNIKTLITGTLLTAVMASSNVFADGVDPFFVDEDIVQNQSVEMIKVAVTTPSFEDKESEYGQP